MGDNVMIRQAVTADLAAINEIYDQAVDTGCSTGDTRHITDGERMEWFREHDDERYPVFIAEAGGRVAGWISLSPYRKGRDGLRRTGEVSYYVHDDFKQKGIGSMLLAAMIKTAEGLQYKRLIAILFDTNSGSMGLLEKYNFEKWGFLPGVIEIDGRIYGHVYYGLKIS